MSELREGLPPLPAYMLRLPVHRGYPVPWFVAWIDGTPEFRIADGQKIWLAVREKRCWVCGERITAKRFAFLIGPMCAINRISSEPPSHIECAEFSAIACPFLSRPHMARREGGLPEEAINPAGQMIKRNPGVSLAWITDRYNVERYAWHGASRDGALFTVGRPIRVQAYAEGRLATLEEIHSSVESGLPLLLATAEQQGAQAVAKLREMTQAAVALLGIEPLEV